MKSSHYPRSGYNSIFTLTLLVATAFVITQARAGEVTLYRDTWGVPHVFAATDADASYGLGYAQAEDRLVDLYTNVLTSTGAMSEVFGPRFIEQDYVIRMIKNAKRCAEYWDTLSEDMRALGDSFMRGVEAYAREHPEKVPDWAPELHGWQTLAIGRTILLNWPLGTIQDELRNKKNSNGFGSNQWSVAPSRSADNVAILLTDPHLTWEGLAVFTEAHVKSATLDMHGFFLVGVPYLTLGHNGDVGWAATTGGPDTSDVYALKINDNLVPQYLYDGEWRNGKVEMITIKVKGQDPVTRPAAYTHLGPIMAEPDRKNKIVYVGASPYFEELGILEQFGAMVRSTNAGEFYKALAMNQYMEQNVMFADRSGNIQYVRTGRVPIRPDGYNWSAPVATTGSETAWLGIHDIKDLVQIRNPAQGYMQNCNISPQYMMKNSPMTPDKYKDYIYNVSWDGENSRGSRVLELLDGDDSVTKEEAMAYAFDVFDIRSPAWQKALEEAVDALGAKAMKNKPFKTAVETILAWNGEYTVDSMAASLMKHWYGAVRSRIDLGALVDGEALSAQDQQALLDGLQQALATMKKLYGKTEVAWGEINRLGRGGKFVGVPGSNFGSRTAGSRTLLSIGVREDPPESGRYVARSGSMSMMLMFFHKSGIESYTCVQWGQSADPESAHYMDQGEQLYSKRRFKPTWIKKEELLKHVESKKVLKTS